ncbi:hypothetical protein BN59_00932 [Legionella massiliensis]|uniref:Uncharacterized protein n=1 Tax=Legionella massiliensis TaxID=1034943 RepID=A0A078KY43_9GAMM|nr:hypothetical protein [Legionella massiliensis]CDZ76658.1 hypothetical protein BN59_00932 [Legionella massiliensis]CEE12396.1 hypothetical protein BN1094_00932 [Legionella massiliensis]
MAAEENSVRELIRDTQKRLSQKCTTFSNAINENLFLFAKAPAYIPKAEELYRKLLEMSEILDNPPVHPEVALKKMKEIRADLKNYWLFSSKISLESVGGRFFTAVHREFYRAELKFKHPETEPNTPYADDMAMGYWGDERIKAVLTMAQTNKESILESIKESKQAFKMG